MEAVVTASLFAVFTAGTFIVYELLKEIGFWEWIIEAAYTHPKFDKIMFIVGDAILAVGTGVVASVSYAYFVNSVFYIRAGIYGTIVIAIGATLKEYFKRGR